MVIPRWYFVLLHLIIGFNFDECNPRAPSHFPHPSLVQTKSTRRARERTLFQEHAYIRMYTLLASECGKHTHALMQTCSLLSLCVWVSRRLEDSRGWSCAAAAAHYWPLARSLSSRWNVRDELWFPSVNEESLSRSLVRGFFREQSREMCACVRPLSAFMHGSRISMKSPFGGWTRLMIAHRK
jgi:hypothetical protein